MALSILILAAGRHEADSISPVYLAEHGGETILELIFKKYLALSPADIAICFLKSDIQKFNVDRAATLLCPDVRIVEIEQDTGGSGCTALFAACQLPQDNELMIISANEFINVDLAPVLDGFRDRQLDGATLTFQSTNPRYSFVKMNEDGQVVEVAQQSPISTHATVGLFWYARAGDFVDAAQKMIVKNARTNDFFFLAPAFNEMILDNKYIGTAPIDKADYWPVKTAAQRKLLEEDQT